MTSAHLHPRSHLYLSLLFASWDLWLPRPNKSTSPKVLCSQISLLFFRNLQIFKEILLLSKQGKTIDLRQESHIQLPNPCLSTLILTWQTNLAVPISDTHSIFPPCLATSPENCLHNSWKSVLVTSSLQKFSSQGCCFEGTSTWSGLCWTQPHHCSHSYYFQGSHLHLLLASKNCFNISQALLGFKMKIHKLSPCESLSLAVTVIGGVASCYVG